MRIELRPQPFQPWAELGRHEENAARAANAGRADAKIGACAVFVGRMRDFNCGAAVRRMTIEHYAGMTERQLGELAARSQTQHKLTDALLLHRVGEITPTEAIVLVAVWSAHRKAAFDACREMMEALKTRATLWKKETRADGDRWVAENTPG